MNKPILQLHIVFAACTCIFYPGCGNTNHNVALFEQSSGFTLKTIPAGKGTGSVETADFNKDGFPDIAVANEEDNSINIFINDGKGNFTDAPGSPFPSNRSPNDIAITDFNNDGNNDLCVANTEISELSVFAGNGKGSFRQVKNSPFIVHSKPHTHGVAAADFNGDGFIDLATDDWGQNKILIIFGDGNGDFNNETFYDVGNRPYQRLRSADVNKDGKPDIVTTNLEGNNATVLLDDGKGKFHEASGSPFACGAAPFGVAVGDVNGDGFPDLAIANSPTITSESKGEDGLWILLGDGTGKFTTLKGSPFKTGRSPSRVAIGDLNGDGINDIVTTNYNDKSITIFYMGKSSVVKSNTLACGDHPDGIAIHDMNGDRKNDILVGNSHDNNVMIFFMK